MHPPATSPFADLPIPAPHQRAFAEAGDWDARTLADMAEERAAATPDGIAFVDGAGSLTFAQLWAEATALCAALHARGLREGDVLAFQVPNWRETAVINLAAVMSGLIINPIVPIYRDAEVSLILGDCRAKALFIPASFRGHDFAAMAARIAPGLPDLAYIFTVRGQGQEDYAALVDEGAGAAFTRPRIDPASIKMVLYTSGTTGRPKGVLHSHATIARIVSRSAAFWGLVEGETTLMPSPVTHISGFANGLEKPLICGTRTILMESWNAAQALGLIAEHGCVGTVAATPFLVELAAAARESGNRLPGFRFFTCGGAAVPADLIPAANASFDDCKAFRVFGASEVPLVTFGWPDDEQLAATTDGRIVDYAVRIVDGEGRDLPDGEEGEILARGPAMLIGYLDPAQTAEAITSDGYFRTGDLGVRTAQGALIITGRKKDLIIRGGENISAREIEDVLQAHPGVHEAAVVAMPHPRFGEGICAFIIPQGAAPDPADLAAHVAASGLAKQKIPERFELATDLPRTASGKVRKDVLRERIKALMEG